MSNKCVPRGLMSLQSVMCEAEEELAQWKSQLACSLGPLAGTLCRVFREPAWHTYARMRPQHDAVKSQHHAEVQSAQP